MLCLDGETSNLPAKTVRVQSLSSYILTEINLAINTILPHLSVDYKVLFDEGSSTENSRMAAGGQCPLACISHRDYRLETKGHQLNQSTSANERSHSVGGEFRQSENKYSTAQTKQQVFALQCLL